MGRSPCRGLGPGGRWLGLGLGRFLHSFMDWDSWQWFGFVQVCAETRAQTQTADAAARESDGDANATPKQPPPVTGDAPTTEAAAAGVVAGEVAEARPIMFTSWGSCCAPGNGAFANGCSLGSRVFYH